MFALIGSLIGGLLRFMPEFLKFFSEKADKKHELEMTQLQLKIDQARATQAIDIAHAQGEMAVQSKEMDALVESIKAQGKPSGIKWIDALNSSVRPFITYWWMLLFTLHKGVTLYQTPTLQNLWNDNDMGILSSIISFWFVDRAIRWKAGR